MLLSLNLVVAPKGRPECGEKKIDKRNEEKVGIMISQALGEGAKFYYVGRTTHPGRANKLARCCSGVFLRHMEYGYISMPPALLSKDNQWNQKIFIILPSKIFIVLLLCQMLLFCYRFILPSPLTSPIF